MEGAPDMSPADLAAAQKKAEAKRQEDQKNAEVTLAREHAKYFSFSDVTWLSTRLTKQEQKSAGGPMEIKPIIEGWLQHRYPRRLKSYAMDLNILQQAMASSAVDINRPISFAMLAKLVYSYQEIHLEAEPMAGFSESSFKKIKGRFDPYDKSGNGLKARELWTVLGDCGVRMTSPEDQQWTIEMVKKMDKDNSGTIDLEEYCQLLRKVTFKREAESNVRENMLIARSGIPVKEAEDWVPVFLRYDTEHRSALSLAQMCNLFSSIGIKWRIEENETLQSWMKEVDENVDNWLDFGEFCCLVRKMVAEDFHGIRSMTSEKRYDGSSSVSATTEAARWSTAKNIQMAWNPVEEEPLSPTFAPRASLDWGDLSKETAGVPSDPMSPKSQSAVSALAEMLAASGGC
jgi:Ca2+-binding EF-hand superfamily protein